MHHHNSFKTLHTPGSGRLSAVVVRSKARPLAGSCLFRVREDLPDEFAASMEFASPLSPGAGGWRGMRRRLKREGRGGMSFPTTRRNAARRSRPLQKLASSAMVSKAGVVSGDE
jgi:hypothetical protein